MADVVPTFSDQTEAKVLVLLMATVHAVLLLVGAVLPWLTVTANYIRTSVEVGIVTV